MRSAQEEIGYCGAAKTAEGYGFHICIVRCVILFLQDHYRRPGSRSLNDILGVEIGGPSAVRKGEAGHAPADYHRFKDLIVQMLDYDADTRIKPLEALRHPFFHRDGSSSAQVPDTLLSLDMSSRHKGPKQASVDPSLVQTTAASSDDMATLSQETVVAMETENSYSNSIQPICPPPQDTEHHAPREPVFRTLSHLSNSPSHSPHRTRGDISVTKHGSLPTSAGSPFSQIHRHSPPHSTGNSVKPSPTHYPNSYPHTAFSGTHGLFADDPEPQEFSFKVSSHPNPFQSQPHKPQVRRDAGGHGGHSRSARGVGHHHRTVSTRSSSQEEAPMLGVKH